MRLTLRNIGKLCRADFETEASEPQKTIIVISYTGKTDPEKNRFRASNEAEFDEHAKSVPADQI